MAAPAVARAKQTWLLKWSVPSRSRADREYTVALDLSGNFGCSCPAWIYARKPKPDCAHIRKLRGMLGLTPGPALSQAMECLGLPLPSAADLDAVAREEDVRIATA